MNTRRSYLDTLNAGRSRKTDSSLEQLSRSLQQLEEQLDMRDKARGQAGAALSFRAAPPPRETPAPRQPAYGRSDPYSDADSITAELNALREEMRQQMSAGLRGEFEALRRELEQAAAVQGRGGSQLSAEMERLADSVHSLAERHDERPLNVLRLELEQMKSAVSALAREETVRSMGDRWDDIDRKLATLQANLRTSSAPLDIDPALAALNERLEQIGMSVNQLPESLSINKLEDKIRNLAGAIDHFARQTDTDQPGQLSAIESRLEEISRAIVATSMSPQGTFDAKPLERIEARLSALAHQLEDAERPNEQVIERINSLSQRVEEIAHAQSLPDEALDALTRQVSLLAAKVGETSGAPAIDELLVDLETRFMEITKRLDHTAAQVSAASEDAILGMHKRLDFLARKIESSHKPAEVDPSLIRSLESQLSALSGLLVNSPPVQAELSDIAPRLDRLEASLAGNRVEIVKAAREAAEEAVRAFDGSKRDSAAVAGLAEDLKSLESLTRKSDDRNTKTFEAIHDTLIKIVDRLTSIDAAPQEKAEPTPRLFNREETPSIDMGDYAGPDLDFDAPKPAAKPRTPAQAAAAAAAAALDELESAPAKPSQEHIVPDIEEESIGPQKAPEIALDAPLDPVAANEPLEPGSRAPDLSAIMSRVRGERETPDRADTEAARSDFIAAARRAAQAAAAEAEVLKRKADLNPPKSKSRLAEIFKARKKPILMGVAAVVVALAGLQLGSSFVSDPQEISAVSEPAPVATAETPKAADDAALAAAPAEPSPVRMVGKAMPAAAAAATTAAAGQDSVSEPGPVTTAAMTPDEDKPVRPAVQNGEDAATPEMTAAVQPAPAPAAAALSAGKIDVPSDAGPIPLREAAASGDPKALFEVGARYAEGRGGKPDMANAAKWYEKAADLGFAPAQYRIGNLYEKGIGVERDVKKAKTWYQMAADQGNASAMHNLAVLFATDSDNESAVRWFGKAAALGVKDSQFNLGILSAKGVGMMQNLEESYKWFALVAKAGDRDAAQKRDEIANSLRPEQLTKARAAVEMWRVAPLVAAANTVDVPESWRESSTTTAGIDMKKAIRNVQALLNKAGYDAGVADGVMGGKTTQAIAAFQKDNGMEATGKIDEKMVKALLAKK